MKIVRQGLGKLLGSRQTAANSSQEVPTSSNQEPTMVQPNTRRPKLLVANDDGINAPGIKALTKALIEANFADVYVCAPNGERSAQSHAITLGRYLSCEPADQASHPGSLEAYSVDGTPADSIMLALHSPLIGGGNVEFDLVLSGINRGDNCGLHVIYSGTVGAAREAACKGSPAIAFSLDNHMARKMDDYTLSAQLAVSLVKAALGLLPGQQPDEAPCKALSGAVINVNFPIAQGQMLQGFHLTHQSTACVFPAFKEVQEAVGPHLAGIDEHTPNSRVFRNYAGLVQADDTEGGDAWAVKNGFVSVSPLGLRQDLLARAAGDSHQQQVEEMVAVTSKIITAAAADAGIAAAGISKM